MPLPECGYERHHTYSAVMIGMSIPSDCHTNKFRKEILDLLILSGGVNTIGPVALCHFEVGKKTEYPHCHCVLKFSKPTRVKSIRDAVRNYLQLHPTWSQSSKLNYVPRGCRTAAKLGGPFPYLCRYAAKDAALDEEFPSFVARKPYIRPARKPGQSESDYRFYLWLREKAIIDLRYRIQGQLPPGQKRRRGSGRS